MYIPCGVSFTVSCYGFLLSVLPPLSLSLSLSLSLPHVRLFLLLDDLLLTVCRPPVELGERGGEADEASAAANGTDDGTLSLSLSLSLSLDKLRVKEREGERERG